MSRARTTELAEERHGDKAPAAKPSRMQGNEALYGYVVAAELIVVAVLNLADTHGPGAPAHPQTVLSLIGLATSLLLAAVVQTRSRFIVPFAAILAAFFVTLPRVPTSLSLAHILALIIPVIYAFVLTQRQRKAATAQIRAAREAGARTQARKKDATSRPARTGPGGGIFGRWRKTKDVPTGPQKNRRYTPPKSKRPKR